MNAKMDISKNQWRSTGGMEGDEIFFFQSIPNFLDDRGDGQKKCGLCSVGLLSDVISAKKFHHYDMSPMFCINQSFFLHKTKLL